MATTMEKLLTVVVLVSSLLLATLADDASSKSSLQHPSPDSLRGRVLGRKGGEEELAYHHYRREGEHKEQHEVVPMELEVERAEERKKKQAGWRDEDEDAVATEGLISSADYSGVAMHGHRSPPAHKKHPKP